MSDAADHQRDAGERELEVAEAAAPGVRRGLEHQHVHRRAGQRQHRAGMRRRRPAASAAATAAAAAAPPVTTTTGSSAATAPLTLISADSTPTNSIISAISRVPAVAGAADQHLPGPGGDAGLLQRGADHEQRGRRRSSPDRRSPRGSGCSVSTPVAQSASAQPTQTTTTGSRSQTKSTITAGDDREDDPDVGHRGPFALRGAWHRRADVPCRTIHLPAQSRPAYGASRGAYAAIVWAGSSV